MSASASSDEPARVLRAGTAPGWTALLVVAALAPLPLGANRPWAWGGLALAVAGLALWRAAAGGPRAAGLALPAALWLTAVAWAGVQALPGLPAGLWHPAWVWTEGAWVAGESTGAGGTIAAVPALAMEGALRLLTYGLAFVLALGAAIDPGRALAAVRILALAAAGYALYGLAVRLSGAETLLWWDKWAYRGVLTATFVNRNAAATLFGFGLLAAVAWRLRRRRASLPLACAGLSATALLLTESRAGVAAAGLGLAVLLGAVALRRGRVWGWQSRHRPGWLQLAGAGTVAVVLLAAGGGVAGRLAATDLLDTDRAPVHAAVRAALGERPWLGQGLGGFDLVFPAHRPPDLVQHWDTAHSSYLENAFELGLPAAAALYGALGVVVARCARGIRRRRRRLAFPALGLAAAVQAGAHAAVDFTLQHPANALWLALLLAVGVAQAEPTASSRKSGWP